MDTPGITVRPIRDMVGGNHFGEVFFDDVRVPASCLIGELNRGWYQIMEQLDYERSGIERLLSNWPLWSDVLRIARDTGTSTDSRWRQRIADVEIKLRCGRGMIYRVAAMLTEGLVPNYEAAAAKTFCTSLEQEIARLASEILGPGASLVAGSPRAALDGRAARALLYAPAYTIQGGTNEILRNVIARRGLGLPD
jgi:alkylation response protein AidB-like acyl-CoA dehydrogenase